LSGRKLRVLKVILRWIYRNIWLKISPSVLEELERTLNDCNTVLDVGCGSSSVIRSLKNKIYTIGIDAWQQSINASKDKGIHDEYYTLDALRIGNKFAENSFDSVIAWDLIEHLTKEEGYKLIAMMERIARRRVIIYTPNGFLLQEEYDYNPWQVHKSGWTASEMECLGYKVIGVSGWKPLRGKYSLVKWRPRRFWETISYLTEPFVRHRPTYAFQLMCVKNL